MCGIKAGLGSWATTLGGGGNVGFAGRRDLPQHQMRIYRARDGRSGT